MLMTLVLMSCSGKGMETDDLYGAPGGRYLSPETIVLGARLENPVKTDNDPCPDGWRVPNYAELDELFKNYSAITTDIYGRAGRWFSGPKPYSTDVPQIFLPVSGKYQNREYIRDDNGYNWSSSTYGQQSLFISYTRKSVQLRPAESYRKSLYSVRCIQE